MCIQVFAGPKFKQRREIANQEVPIIHYQTEGIQQHDDGRFFTSLTYSLFSPRYQDDSFKTQNQDSLGSGVYLGYMTSMSNRFGVQAGLGLIQNAKTERSLPDFVFLKPGVALNYQLNDKFYLSAGLFGLSQQSSSLKKFKSNIGYEYFLAYRAHTNVDLRFGVSQYRFKSEFEYDSVIQNTEIFIRGIESQILYLF